MKFLIYDRAANGYLNIKHDTWVDWEYATRFKSEETAKNYLNFTLSASQSIINCEIVTEKKQEMKEEEESAEVDISMTEEALRIYHSLITTLTDDVVIRLITLWEEELNYYNGILCDLQHKIELDNLSDTALLWVVKEERNARLKRREAKDNIRILSCLSKNLAINEVNKTMKTIEERRYTPRVLPNLFTREFFGE